ncbi:MAG TPA: glycosyl transferase family 1 [Treponema sp.]|nr:glycosyl transferase family 1 [Treponema sp.]
MYLTMTDKIQRVGFVSTRFQGTDGVSMETQKWRTVLEHMGYECFFFSGLSDWDPSRSMVVDEAYFNHPLIAEIQRQCFGVTVRSETLSGEIQAIRFRLKRALHEFVSGFSVDLLIIENAVTIPMNIPLGLAITEFIAETGMPAIAHHHDFAWERQRFSVSAVEDYLAMAFPPRLHSISHVVINSEGRRQLSYRCGLSATIIPNVFDFHSDPPVLDEYGRGFRADLGLEPADVLFLQPTRVIARKGIEHSVELAGRFKDRKVKLLISHQERDEGSEYYHRTMDYAALLGVDVLVHPELIGSERGMTADGRKRYSLWDCYLNADFVTYPSTYEGFGNAFLEALWFKKPILVNRYSIFQQDIEPIGFEVVQMENYVTPDTVDQVRSLLDAPFMVDLITERNFNLGRRFFSYELLEQRLRHAFMNFGQI